MSSPPDRDKNRKVGESRLGKYRILSKLGRGGMGVVYAAEDTLLKRLVAIKVLASTVAKNPHALERFLREAQAAARLTHPHVVAIHEIGQHGGIWFIAMEMISGGNLADYLAEQQSISWIEATRLIAQACRGLVAAHQAGLVHRDIKPANLMRTADGQVKLVDFGLAKAREETSTLTAAGTVVGTPYFMSPEQWRTEPLDDLSDVYSLGATYYTLLTHQPPYVRRDPLQVMYACCSEPPPDPRELNAEVPDACAAIVLKAMAKDPSQRYAHAQAMLDDLQALLTQPNATPLTLTPAASVGATPQIQIIPTREMLATRWRSGRDRRSAWVLRSVLLVAAMALAAWFWRPRIGGEQALVPRDSAATHSSSASADGWKSLFNGRDLTGWWKLKSPPGEWTVEDGVLVGRMRQGGRDPSSYLLTERRDYGDFECRAEVRISDRGNSGIFFRCNSQSSLPQGLEAHLSSNECGDLHRTWAQGELPKTVVKHPLTIPSGRWATVEISARGSHIVIRVNGSTTADVTEHEQAPASGYLALQVFDVGTEIAVRKFEIRELP